MKKVSFQLFILIFFILFSAFQVETKSSQENIIPFEWKRINGIILTKDYEMPPIEEQITRFTPTKEEIIKAENILQQQIEKLNEHRYNQFGDCPVIHRHLNAYFRQYVGIIDSNGNRIIHINCLWNKHTLWDRIRGYHDSRDSYKTGYSIVFDGCSYYWSVNANLTENKLFNLAVNGVA